ncbi:MAG: hypothetical protein U1E97_03090 [Alphaproteobacteria bacterium]
MAAATGTGDRTQASAASPSDITLAGRYRIFADSRVPEFDSPGAVAFAAVDMDAQAAPMFALVCDGQAPVRLREMAMLRRQDHEGSLSLKEWGIVPWGADGVERVAVVFNHPPGARITVGKDGNLPKIPEDQMVSRVIQPALPILSFLGTRGSAHRAIRPANMYHGDAATAPFVFGECVICPPGLHQPVVFETIERSMADPAARGQGTVNDDLYALGILIVAFLFGRMPGFGKADEQIVDGKVDAGTYAWLLNRRVLPRGLIEPIRGLVSDDPRARWTVDDLSTWAADHSMRPRKQTLTKSPRPFTYRGRDYPNMRMLARAFAKDWSAAAAEVRQGRLVKWVQRNALEDSRGIAGNAIAVAMAQLNAGMGAVAGRQESRLVAQVCVALDPLGPIRYENLSVMSDGIGTAIATAQGDDNRHRALLDLLRSELPIFWIDRSRDMLGKDTQAGLVMRRVIHALKRPGPGFGPERVLYELNPTLHCQSSMVGRRFVTDVDTLLAALEESAGTIDSDKTLLDRHVAAFIAARFNRDIDRHLLLLADRGDRAGVASGTLAILAAIQAQHGPRSLPRVAAWVGGMLDPVIATFSNRTLREKIEAQVRRLVKDGNLNGLAALLIDSRWKAWDAKMRLAARADFMRNEAEIARLKGRDGRYTARGQKIGYRLASIVSMCMALFALARVVSQYAS